MRKLPSVFTARLLAGFSLLALGICLAAYSFAANVGSGALTDTSAPLKFTTGPFYQSNQSPVGLGQLDTGPRCDDAAFPCSTYTLTVNLPSGYVAAHPNAAVKVTMSWQDTGTGKSDYDLYIFKNPRADCTPNDCSQPSGSNAADYQSASSSNPEIANISPLQDGSHKYTIFVNPYQPTGETVDVKMELLPGSGPGGTPGFGGPDPATPGVPRYQNFYAPNGTSAQSGSGEFNIGFDPKTGRIMTMNSGPVWRITPPEVQKPAKPECCEGLWEDKSSAVTNTGLDPILWTDQVSGRTFVSNSTAGANAVYAYSDDDGDTYTPVGAAPPNGGADHQTIGTGPYPALLSALSTPVNQGRAVYYCSQDIVGPAACQRSDTLGSTYGPGTLAYNGQGASTPGGTDCGGLHGHVHVAPDGTVWLPVKQCGGSQGGVFSTDGGSTWTEFKVPGAASQTNGADPSIAIDDKSNIYYSYINSEKVPTGQPAEGHPRAVAGHLNADNTITWSTPVDLGTTHGIKNAAHIEAVGGSAGRAAVGFIASDVPGDYQALSYPGRWYAFIATTYDGGKTWTTVNATPNDPVQSHTGVWQQGGGAQDRNLLDFNEITVDDKGRVLYGYSDGCVTAGCIADTAGNDFTAFMRVARQSGGRSIFASFDGKTDTTVAVPAKPACLSGLRDASGSHLTWKAPDNGGAEITNYYIYRGTVTAGENFITPIGQSTGKTTYTDATADPAVPDYFYVVKAITSAGFGAASNEIDLKLSNTPVVIQTPCALPGLTILTDKPNDELDNVPAHDVQLLAIGEPLAFGDKLVFTLKVQSLATLPPDTEWPIKFIGADGKNYTVQMTTLQTDDPTNPAIATTPEFQVRAPGGTSAADPASKYTPDGSITIVVPKSSVGSPKIGDKLSAFLVRITAGLITPDNMPDSLAPSGSYTVVGNATFCAPNAAPTAILSGTPDHGPAPLTVNFTGSGTDPDNDAIASYTFDFGDGTPPVTQTSPTISHTYNAAGEFRAQLQVTDARGKLSTNTALFPIDVSAVLRNISTRANVQTDDNVLIGGLIISGNSPRTIVLRGIGPSIKANSQPLAGTLQDPTIELHNSSGIVATNDNWKTDDATGQSQQAAVENTGLAPTDDRESAIVKSLSPGLYTVVMRGKGNSTGLGVVEAYDVDPTGVSKLANLSTRALVGTGANIVIGGFIVGPTNAANMKLLLRGIGPSLSNSNVPNPLQDPVLDVRDSNGNRIGSNNDWKDSQQADIQATGIAPSDDREAAVLYPEISPGLYTVLLSGNGGTTGVGSIEMYNVP